jgi:uncharacterized protein (DUF2249 family)
MAGAHPTRAGRGVTEPELVSDLTRVLDRALRELGDAGRTERASELAAEGWVLLRAGAPRAAERLNGTLHYLSRSPAGASDARETMDATDDPELDVREDAPAERHRKIFDAFEALDAGRSFVLVNDHDPKPLFYQFQAERPGAFVWETLEEGPEVWRARIGRAVPHRSTDA